MPVSEHSLENTLGLLHRVAKRTSGSAGAMWQVQSHKTFPHFQFCGMWLLTKDKLELTGTISL